MNYNANSGNRLPGPTRKVKRVSDVNAMGGPAVPMQSSFIQNNFDPSSAVPMPQQPQQMPAFNNNNSQHQQQQQPMHPNVSQNQIGFDINMMSSSATSAVPIGFNPNTTGFNQQYGQYPNINQSMPQQQQQQPQHGPAPPYQPNVTFPPQMSMFKQPIVQDMALQYGQKLADQGKQIVESHIEKYVPITRLKYYFAVDNKYVINKMRLLFFPYLQRDWSLKYDQDNPVQPRYDINAPDLYIPAMAYITYIVLAGLVLGMQNRFSPEQLGIMASSALAYIIFELIIYSITLYVTNISTTLKTLDLLAYSGYKYVVIVTCVLVSILFQRFGYYVTLLYCSLSLGFFLLRTLKAKVLHESSASASSSSSVNQSTYGADHPYGVPQQSEQIDYTVGRKRKLYFLFLVAGFQPILSFWLSMHLIPPNKIE